MAILTFMVQLLGAVMLLLYAVNMVRTGIERAFGASFKRLMTRSDSLIVASCTGIFAAIILQSSAAVTMLISGFVTSGTLPFATGLAIVLGGDLGSALLIQLLSFDLQALVPLLFAVGGLLFLRMNRIYKSKQLGRIVMGIAFVLTSLQFLRQTMEPIRQSEFLPVIMNYLQNDFVAAFILGAVLAFVMHSSIAVILMCVTLVSIGVVPIDAGILLVLGANFGSSTIPVWLSRHGGNVEKRIPWANFTLRGSIAVIVLMVLSRISLPDVLATPYLADIAHGQLLIMAHVAFNGMLILFLPFCTIIQPFFERQFPHLKTKKDVSPDYISVLDNSLLDNPKLALTNLQREILRMSRLVEMMATPIMDVLEKNDVATAKKIIKQDDHINKTLDAIRAYVSDLPADMSSEEHQKTRALTEYAIALERSGDIIVQQLMPRVIRKSKEKIAFSAEGEDEIRTMYEQLISNIGLSANVLISDDVESASLLLEQKSEMTRMERNSRDKHFNRLKSGQKVSVNSSDIHLETLRSLRDLNSQICAIAYPILSEKGLLRESRLILDSD